MSVTNVFGRFAGTDGAKVGMLLAAYGNLEVDLMHCVQVVRDDLDTTLKAMFRVRGESARIAVADALGRQAYINLKLESEFGEAIASLHHCRKIRNHYAHCVWYDDWGDKLGFVDLEELANENACVTDLKALTRRVVDMSLLNAQVEYFDYTSTLLTWINFEGRYRAGKLPEPLGERPTRANQPPLHLP